MAGLATIPMENAWNNHFKRRAGLANADSLKTATWHADVPDAMTLKK